MKIQLPTRNILLLAAVLVLIAAAFSLTGSPTKVARADGNCPSNPNSGTSDAIYRYYGNTGSPDHFEHFLSTSNLQAGSCEGVLGYSATTQIAGTVPLYHLVKTEIEQPSNLTIYLYTAYFYTTSSTEYGVASAGGWSGSTNPDLGYVVIDPNQYAGATHPIYRYRHNDDYLYSLSSNEVGSPWTLEGVAFYLFNGSF